MAGERVLGSMLVKILGQNAEFDSSIDNSQKKLDNFGKSASKIGGNLTKFITLPLVGIGVAAIKSASDMESAQIAFETLLGSGEKAKVLLGQLKQFASTTPFEFQDLAQGTKTLLSFGIAVEDVLPITKQLGDIALGDSEKYKSLALVFGQISSTGRLMGQDLLQLINVGFNPLQEISKTTGESMAELKKRMEAGGISADEVAKAFKSATSEGGRFFQGTEKLGKSFAGQLSTLKDDAVDLARSFGEILLPTLKDIIKTVSGVIQEFNKLDPETKKSIINFALAAAAAGPLVLGLGKVAGAISGVVKAVGIAKTAITSLATLNPVFLWAGALGIAIGLVGGLVEALRNANRDTEDAINKQFGITLFDETKTIKENGDAFRDAEKKLKSYEKTVAFLEGRLASNGILTVQQTNQLNEAKNAVDLLTPSVTRLKEGYTGQVNAMLAAKKEQGGLTAETTTAEIKTTSLSKAIAYQNSLVLQGAITEEEALKSKIKLRDDEIDTIIKAGAATGRLTSEQMTQVLSLNALNKENQERLSELSKSSDDYFNDLADGYLESADAALEYFNALDAQNAAEEKRQQSLDDLADSYLASADEAIDSLDKIDDADEANSKRQLERNIKEVAAISSSYQMALGVATSFFSALSELYAQDSANKIASLTQQHDAQLALLDSQLQTELAANGVADLSAVELAQKKLDAAKAGNDAEAISEAEKALLKAQIEQKYADQVVDINKKFEKEKAQEQYKGELAAWDFKLLAALASAPVAIINAIQTGYGAGFPAGLVLGPALGVAAGISTAIQLGAIASAKPKPPKLAEGGIVMPRAGGVQAIVAEAGQPEAVIPLDRMNEFIDNRGFGGGASQSSESFPISLTIKLSERQLYKGIFQATKNREILIDAQSVVNQ